MEPRNGGIRLAPLRTQLLTVNLRCLLPFAILHNLVEALTIDIGIDLRPYREMIRELKTKLLARIVLPGK